MSNNPTAPTTRPPADDPRSTESIPQLVRDLASDLSTLFSKELSLAKAEVRQAASDAQKSISAVAFGAGLAFGGMLFVLLAIMFGLASQLSLWLSALIVGVVALIIGYAMVKAAQSKLKPAAFVPERTAESVRKDTEAAKRAVH